MIRTFFVFILFVCFLNPTGYCQEKGTVLKGPVTLQNSNGKPVSGVQITVPGLEVVNSKAMEAVLTENSDDLVQDVMCIEGGRDELVRTYYEIIQQSINKNYEKRLKQLEGTIIDAEQKNKSLTDLQSRRDAALAQAKKLAETFSMVNLGEASRLYKKAFQYFQAGNIEKALEIMEDKSMDKALLKAKKKQKPAKALKKYAANYMLKARLSIINLQFDQAESYYQNAVDTAPDHFDNILEFFYYLFDQKKFIEAQIVFKKAASAAKSDSQKARVLNVSGDLNTQAKKYSIASQSYQKALEIFENLVKEYPRDYLPDLANVLYNLGELNNKTFLFADSLPYYKRALEIYGKLVYESQITYETYMPKIESTLLAMAESYVLSFQPKEAPHCYKKLANIYEKLAPDNPKVYLPKMAKNLSSNLGYLLYVMEQYKEALPNYKKALEIYKQLTQKNPKDYLPDMADTLNKMSRLYYRINRSRDAVSSSEKALEIWRKLAKEKPQAYLKEVAYTLFELGAYYYSINRISDLAMSAYKEALEIWRKLAAENPKAYLSNLADTLSKLGTVYFKIHQAGNALPYYKEELEIREKSAKKYPLFYLASLGNNLINLGAAYCEINEFSEALPFYQRALKIFEKLVKGNPKTYLDGLARVHCNLGVLYRETDQFSDALSCFQKALEAFKKLALDDPQKFDLNVCALMLDSCLCYSKLIDKEPQKSKIYKNKALELVNLAIPILEKYPKEWKARDYMRGITYWKKHFEKASVKKK